MVDAWRAASPQDGAVALKLARRAFDTYSRSRDVIDPPASLPKLFRQRVGVFVSTMIHGAPRTCMGTLYPTEPDAAREIINSAVLSAGRDRRFPMVKPAELKGLTLIVSIVGQPHPMADADLASMDPARDGLAVRCGDRYGVVLNGETTLVDRMVKWGRIRAGAGPASSVEYFKLDVVRFMEKQPLQERPMENR